jgi:hypothetical protein
LESELYSLLCPLRVRLFSWQDRPHHRLPTTSLTHTQWSIPAFLSMVFCYYHCLALGLQQTAFFFFCLHEKRRPFQFSVQKRGETEAVTRACAHADPRAVRQGEARRRQVAQAPAATVCTCGVMPGSLACGELQQTNCILLVPQS